MHPSGRSPRARAVVTGGAGFVGSALATELVDAGSRVTVLDNLSTGSRGHLAHLPGDRVSLVEGDVRDTALCERLLEGADVLFHLACVNLRRALAHPIEAHEVNATATLHLMAAARRAGIRRVVQVSSSEVYGPALAETIDERHPTLPTTAYGASKLAGEAYARAAWHTHGTPVVIVRPFNAFGPRSHAHGTSGEVIPRFITRAVAGAPLVIFGDGSQTRDFTHVTDTARGLRLAAEAEGVDGETVNLGTGWETSVSTLATLVRRLAGTSAGVERRGARPGDVSRQRADARLARTRLGWQPRVTLEQGLRDLVALHRASAPSKTAAVPVASAPDENWELTR
jgi:UDP-glucose 4-epimerase